jgi:hypothetical protein
MAEDYVSDLQTLREVHVSERRRLVLKAIESAEANDSPGGGAATLGQDVVEQQRLIEAIDRAIADESNLTHKSSSTTARR